MRLKRNQWSWKDYHPSKTFLAKNFTKKLYTNVTYFLSARIYFHLMSYDKKNSLNFYLGVFKWERRERLCNLPELHDFVDIGSDFRLVFRIRIRVNEQRRKWMLYVKRFSKVAIELSLSVESLFSCKIHEKWHNCRINVIQKFFNNFKLFVKQERIPVGCVPPALVTITRCQHEGLYLSGCTFSGGMYLPGVEVSTHQAYIPAVDRQTPVKTLPLWNYCFGG